MARFKLEQFRSEIKKYLQDNYESLCEWIIAEGNNVREGVDIEVRRDNICYGIFFHLPYELQKNMERVSEWQDVYIANIMISIIKEMGVYSNIQ